MLKCSSISEHKVGIVTHFSQRVLCTACRISLLVIFVLPVEGHVQQMVSDGYHGHLAGNAYPKHIKPGYPMSAMDPHTPEDVVQLLDSFISFDDPGGRPADQHHMPQRSQPSNHYALSLASAANSTPYWQDQQVTNSSHSKPAEYPTTSKHNYHPCQESTFPAHNATYFQSTPPYENHHPVSNMYMSHNESQKMRHVSAEDVDTPTANSTTGNPSYVMTSTAVPVTSTAAYDTTDRSVERNTYSPGSSTSPQSMPTFYPDDASGLKYPPAYSNQYSPDPHQVRHMFVVYFVCYLLQKKHGALN